MQVIEWQTGKGNQIRVEVQAVAGKTVQETCYADGDNVTVDKYESGYVRVTTYMDGKLFSTNPPSTSMGDLIKLGAPKTIWSPEKHRLGVSQDNADKIADAIKAEQQSDLLAPERAKAAEAKEYESGRQVMRDTMGY